MVGVLVQIQMVIDVLGCGIVGRIARNLRLTGQLVHAHIINQHFGRELDLIKVDLLESIRNTYILHSSTSVLTVFFLGGCCDVEVEEEETYQS